MVQEVGVRTMRENEAEAVSRLVMRAFQNHVGHEYPPEGVAEFTDYARPEAILERARAGNPTLVAVVDGVLAGMVQFREGNHLSMLFVADEHLRRGVARRLFEHGLEQVRMGDSDLVEVTVNSSRYAVPVYERFGFVPSGQEATVNGITFVPMVLELDRE